MGMANFICAINRPSGTYISEKFLSSFSAGRKKIVPVNSGNLYFQTKRPLVLCKAEPSGGSNFLENFAGKFVEKRKIESDSLPADLRESTIGTVEAIGGRATAGDIASRAGIKLTDAERALKALATDSGGYLEVSDDGDVLYVLPKDVRSVLLQKSLQLTLEPYVKAVNKFGQYMLRVTFGSALLASIAITYTAVFIVLTSSKSEDDNRGRQGGYQRSQGPSFYINPFDLLWYWNPSYNRRNRSQNSGGGVNFFETVFSFVFGDGNPNEGFEEMRWKIVGECITRKGGVVTAEELAPFLDPPAVDNFDTRTLRDESFMVPVLQRFDGVPQVDSKGHILYRFPSLQRTAVDWTGRKQVRFSEDADLGGNYLVENTWSFSQSSEEQRFLAGGLGVLNIVGVVFLGSLLRDPVVLRQVGSSFVYFTSQALPFLQAYALSFFVIPAVRWWVASQRNADIVQRNVLREQWADYGAKQSPDLIQKRQSARKLAELTVIGDDKIVYSTNKDMADQQFEGIEFDRKVRES